MSNLIVPLAITGAFFLGLVIEQKGPADIVGRARAAAAVIAVVCLSAAALLYAVGAR